MFEILVNGNLIQLLQPVSEVNSLVIRCVRRIPIPIHKSQVKPVSEWLYNITQQVDDIIEYNGILMYKESINKPTHMKD